MLGGIVPRRGHHETRLRRLQGDMLLDFPTHKRLSPKGLGGLPLIIGGAANDSDSLDRSLRIAPKHRSSAKVRIEVRPELQEGHRPRKVSDPTYALPRVRPHGVKLIRRDFVGVRRSQGRFYGAAVVPFDDHLQAIFHHFFPFSDLPDGGFRRPGG